MRIQLAKETRQLPVGKKFSGLGCWCSKTPWGKHDFRICSDSNSDITSALEIANSGANLVSDRKVVFSRNLGCALADFYGHYSSRDLQIFSSLFTDMFLNMFLRVPVPHMGYVNYFQYVYLTRFPVPQMILRVPVPARVPHTISRWYYVHVPHMFLACSSHVPRMACQVLVIFWH